MRALTIATLLAALVGCGATGLEGTLLDEAGNPFPDGATLKLKAVGEVGLTCQQFGGPVDPATGAFSIEKVCTSESAYTIKLSDEGIWLAEMGEVPVGHTGPLNLIGYRHGGGPGVYHAKTPTDVIALRTGADLKKTTKDGAALQYLKKVAHITVVPAGETILVNGADKVEKMAFHPLTWTPGPVTLGTADAPLEVPEGAGIWTVGPAAAADASKFKTKEHGDVKLTYIPGDALAAGRYAYFSEKDSRPWLFDFGAAQADPTAAPE